MKLHNYKIQNWEKALFLLAMEVVVVCIASFAISLMIMSSVDVETVVTEKVVEGKIISEEVETNVLKDTPNLLVLNGLFRIIIFAGVAWLYQLLFCKKGTTRKMFSQGYSWKTLLVAIICMIVGALISSSMTADSQYNIQLEKMMPEPTYWGLLLSIISMALIPAIVEEWLFRGVIQKLLIDWTRYAWVGIVLTAAIFSAIHFDMPNFAARFVLGLFLGFAYYYTKNIWTNITMHFLNNGVAAFGFWYALRSGEEITQESYSYWYLGLLAFIICVVVLLLYERKHPSGLFVRVQPQQEQIEESVNTEEEQTKLSE